MNQSTKKLNFPDVTTANEDVKHARAPKNYQNMRNKAKVLIVGDSITHNANFRLQWFRHLKHMQLTLMPIIENPTKTSNMWQGPQQR